MADAPEAGRPVEARTSAGASTPTPSQGIDVHTSQAGSGRHRVDGVALVCGRDVTVTIGGGTSYHVGACAVAVPRPSLADPARRSASASVICVTGHLEDDLARRAALDLATQLGCVVTVAAGLHVDDASSEDIATLSGNATIVVGNLTELLTGQPAG